MRKQLCTLLGCLVMAVMAAVGTGCHSSKKTVKSGGNAVVRTVDYGKMRSDLKSRHYDVPLIGALIGEASAWVGVPYKYAGTDKRGVDCSGLTSQVFLKIFDVKMPRSSREQQQWCSGISKDNLRPGDLVFFATGSKRDRVSHVGIYVGGGDIIHASSSRGVIVSNLDEKYYLTRYHSAGRPEVIKHLYASADKKDKKGKKNKGKQKNEKEKEILPVSPTHEIMFNTPPDSAGIITVSVDDLIEMQVDSIANAIATKDIPAPLPAPALHTAPSRPQEPADSTFSQFFD